MVLGTLRTFVLAAMLWGVAAPAAGQVVTGRVVDGDTSEPLQGVFVVLLDGVGVERGAVLTNRDGRYLLHAPGPGRYAVHTERIGYDEETSASLELAADETRIHDVAIRTRAIPLASITVDGKQRCTVRPGSGLRTADVWEEARKALRTAAWTEAEGTIRFRAIGYERDLDRETQRVLDERRTGRQGYTSGSPYESLPAEDLAANGYVRPVKDGAWDYFAPDARVLLSDPFLDGHCFELVEHESRPELIGLAFRPVSRGRNADIQGALWLDRQSSELRYLEYTYTNLPYPVDSPLIGGKVEFDRLEGGPWIVRSWRIRTPQVALMRRAFDAMRVNRQSYEVARIHEVGAEVQDVVGSEGASLLAEANSGGSVTGVVYDARGNATVADAEVSLVGTLLDARSGKDGAFELHGVPEGLYQLRVTADTWDLPWLPPVTAELTIREGDTSQVRLRLPEDAAIVSSLCGHAAEDTLPGAVAGRVTDATTGMPATGRKIVAVWSQLVVVDDGLGLGMRGPWHGTAVVSDGEGWYLACGLPAGTPIRIGPMPPYDESSEETARRLTQPDLRLPADAREFRVEYANPIMRLDLEVRQAAVREFRTRVVDEASRDPLAGAEITLLAEDSTEISHTTSGPDGTFSLAVRPGRYIIRIQHPGFDTLLQPVTLEEGQSVLPAFVLRTVASPLDPLVVDIDRADVSLGTIGHPTRSVHVLAGESMARMEKLGVAFTTAVRDPGSALRLESILHP